MDDHDTMRIGPGGRDDAVTRALRALYAAPHAPGYWEALEGRIMARVALEGDAWWSPFRGWVRAGLAAATVALALAGMALARTHQAETRIAYQTIVETPRDLQHQIATETSGLSDREATLRYVIAP
ncbi:MAG: hypothetical protein M3373_06500 [Gemmatimonadota bacterium]|nr:hypothetical protein [Gemmatimonadota bacterium]